MAWSESKINTLIALNGLMQCGDHRMFKQTVSASCVYVQVCPKFAISNINKLDSTAWFSKSLNSGFFFSVLPWGVTDWLYDFKKKNWIKLITLMHTCSHTHTHTHTHSLSLSLFPASLPLCKHAYYETQFGTNTCFYGWKNCMFPFPQSIKSLLEHCQNLMHLTDFLTMSTYPKSPTFLYCTSSAATQIMCYRKHATFWSRAQCVTY